MRRSGVLDRVAGKLAYAGALATCAFVPLGSTAAEPATPTPTAFIETYCGKCHNATDWAGSLAFDTLDVQRPDAEPEVWENAVGKLRGRLMPPAGERQPQQPEIDSLVAFLESGIDRGASPHVGYVPIQRLNRLEFAASVKGLLGVEVDARQMLPQDIEVEGFSNIAGALGVSPAFVEQYLSAARRVAKLAVGEPVAKVTSVFYRDEGSQQSQRTWRPGFPLGTRGGTRFTHVFPADGEYRFSFIEGDSLGAGLYPSGMETAATLVVLIDGKEVARRQIGGAEDLALADREGPQGRDTIVGKVSNVPANVTAGPHEVIVTFVERSWAASNDATGGGRMTSMPIVRDGIQVMGPFSRQGISTNASRAKVFICQPRQGGRRASLRRTHHASSRDPGLPPSGERRRRAAPDEVLRRGASRSGRFRHRHHRARRGGAVEPRFPLSRHSRGAGARRHRVHSPISSSRSRLSFFLWNENPDDMLLRLATSRQLSDPAVLQAQVDRMLKDRRAQSLVENFALAWLNLDELEEIEPSDVAFNSAMRANFETEIRLFLSSVLLENRSVVDLLNADWTFLNEALARQYGVGGVFGPQFRRVRLEDENRWGLLGKGAVLLRTSYADRTSPVLRGAWVLDRLVGAPPAPPPPDVVTDLSVPAGEKPRTVRARLEAHRANATCQGCHGLIDPPGLALENFDVAGRWREVDAAAKEKIDATATLTSGTVLHGPADLRRSLNARADQFPTTVTKRLMMYALNREIEYFDMPQVRQVVRDAAIKDYTFAALVKGVVASDAFRRQGAKTSTVAAAQ